MRRALIAILLIIPLLPSTAPGLSGVRVLARIGGKGEGDGKFSSQIFIEFDREGNLYISDAELNRVQKFSPDGRLAFKIEPDEKSPFKFTSISDIAVDGEGKIYLLDWKFEKVEGSSGQILYRLFPCVHVFSPEGEFIRDIDLRRLGDPKGLSGAVPAVTPEGMGFVLPHGDPKRELRLAVSRSGERIFVLDSNRVIAFDGEGEVLNRFGREIVSASDIAADRFLIVLDKGADRLLKYSLDGKLISSIGRYGYERGELVDPFRAAISPDGSIYVLDRAEFKRFSLTGFKRRAAEPLRPDPDLPEEMLGSGMRIEKAVFRRVQKFSPDGELLSQITIRLEGEEVERFELVAVSPTGEVYLRERDSLSLLRARPEGRVSSLIRASKRELGLRVSRLKVEVEIDNPDDLDTRRDFTEDIKGVGFDGRLLWEADLDERTRVRLSTSGGYAFFRTEDHFARMDIRTRLNQDDKTLEDIASVRLRLDVDVKLNPDPYDYRTASFYAFIGRGRYDMIIDALAPDNQRYLEWNLWYTEWGGGLACDLRRDWRLLLTVYSAPAFNFYDYDLSYIDEGGSLFATAALRGREVIVRFYLSGGLD
ncbi:hypothetical protein DRP77_05315 [Candidatus Poribacteria bacterium]|nr:MAG: hypothetical protein DRP77_05315 [Candidatus Poribacteria bacterium]